jgi:hypothetical protein
MSTHDLPNLDTATIGWFVTGNTLNLLRYCAACECGRSARRAEQIAHAPHPAGRKPVAEVASGRHDQSDPLMSCEGFDASIPSPAAVSPAGAPFSSEGFQSKQAHLSHGCACLALEGIIVARP